MPRGKVRFVHPRRGYGFITTEQWDDEPYFFHPGDVVAQGLEAGDEVTFETEERDGSPRAVRVTRAGD